MKAVRVYHSTAQDRAIRRKQVQAYYRAQFGTPPKKPSKPELEKPVEECAGQVVNEKAQIAGEVMTEKKMTNRELKSKVVSLGNRLAPRMGRSAAFIRAWAIVKAGGLELAVKGVSFGNRQEALRRLAQYEPAQVRAFIVPEPENKADRKAARVMVGIQGGRGLYCLGYLPAEYAPAASSLKASGLRVLDGDIRGARLALAV
jgi:hypothetical protein